MYIYIYASFLVDPFPAAIWSTGKDSFSKGGGIGPRTWRLQFFLGTLPRGIWFGDETSVKGWRYEIHEIQRFLGGGNSNIFYFHPYLVKIPILTIIFFRWVVEPPPTLVCREKGLKGLPQCDGFFHLEIKRWDFFVAWLRHLKANLTWFWLPAVRSHIVALATLTWDEWMCESWCLIFLIP